MKALAIGACRTAAISYFAVVMVFVAFWVVPTVVAVPAVTVEPLARSLASVTTEVFTDPAVTKEPLARSLASVTMEVCTDPAVTLEPLVRSLFLESADTELVLVVEPLRLVEFVPVESEFVVVEPSGLADVFVVDETTEESMEFVAAVFVAALCVADAVWIAFAFSEASWF